MPVFAIIVWVNYFSSERIAREAARNLIERFRVETIASIDEDFNGLKSLVRAAGALGDQLPSIYADERSVKYFHSILVHSQDIVSVYAALNDGSFRQARRIDPGVRIFNEFPPKGTVVASRFVEPGAASTLLDRYVFLDHDGKALGELSAPTSYDPRSRGWYRNTAAQGTLRVTEPDLFAAFGLVGLTIATPFLENGKVAGVVAMDLTLDSLGHYLAQRKISPGAMSYLLDSQSRVIAASDKSKTYTTDGGRVELKHITAVDSDLAAAAYSARPRDRSDPHLYYSFTRDGRQYVASLSSLREEFGRRWHLFTVTPLDNFTGPFNRNNDRLVLFGLAAILAQIVIIYFLSSVISRPLERLAGNVDDIRRLAAESRSSVASPIREISTLSGAIGMLDHAVKSFSAFVPVGLVRQLLETEKKLELGGRSRFLTVMFSDLEAFSTLSEEMPSQDLMLRVSAYLDLATQVVDGELGTVDKFIGDGVMAFWGAPALLEDHAWRACVAALRIRRELEGLNERWRAEGHKPLKLRVGIHSDAVLVGNIGSMRRMSYTVIGDGVNVAARLEQINKEYGTGICISHSVYKEAGERLCVRPVGDVAVKGRRTTIPIYELLGTLGSDSAFEPGADTLELCRLTRRAYDAMVGGDKTLALARYREVLTAFPQDMVARELIARLERT